MIDQSQRKEGAILNDKSAISGIRNRDERVINDVIDKYSKLLWPIASAALKPEYRRTTVSWIKGNQTGQIRIGSRLQSDSRMNLRRDHPR